MANTDVLSFHQILSGYFSCKPIYLDESNQKNPNTRKLVEQPWQQTKGEMWDEVTDTLCNLDFIQAKAASKMTYELVNDFNEVLEVIPDNAENILIEKERQTRLDKYTQDLISYAKGEIKVLEVPDTITPWSEELVEEELDRIETKLTRLDKLKSFNHFIGQESGNLQKYAADLAGIAIQQAWNNYDDGPVGNAANNAPSTNRSRLMLMSQTTRAPWQPLPLSLRTFSLFGGEVISITITQDSKFALTTSNDMTCVIWDMKNGKPVKTLNLKTGPISSALCAAITPDGKLAVLGLYEGTCILWKIGNGNEIQYLSGHKDIIYSVAITADGRQAVSASKDKTCIIWDIEVGKPNKTLRGHTEGINSISITPDGKKMISASDDKTCILWDMESGERLKTLTGHTGQVTFVTITTDGKKAVSASVDRTCIIWDIETGIPKKTLDEHFDIVHSVAITPDGKYALSGSWDHTCIYWDLESGKALKTLYGHSDSVHFVGITSDGRIGLSSSADRKCIIWDLEKGAKQRLTGYVDELDDAAISPRKDLAISISKINNYCDCDLWELTNFDLLETLVGHSGSITSAIFTPDDNLVFTSSHDNTSILWDIENGKPIFTLTGHSGPINSIILTPDGKTAVSASDDKTCIVWDLNSGKQLKTLMGHSDKVKTVLISPCGKLLISGSDNEIILWDIKSSRLLKRITPPQLGFLEAMTISPDGKQLLFNSRNYETIIWDLSNNIFLKALNGHSDLVTNILVTPDGKYVFTTSWDKTCILWDILHGEILARFLGNEVKTVSNYKRGILLGIYNGEPYLLNLPEYLSGMMVNIVTIKQIWDFKSNIFSELLADCPYCGHRFKPTKAIIQTIIQKLQEAHLKPEQSPCMELHDKAWDNPELISTCPKCAEALIFNPFIAWGDDNQLIELYQKASKASMFGQIDPAIKLLNDCLDMSELFLKCNHYVDKLEDCRINAHIMLGNIYLSQHDYNKSLFHYKTAKQLTKLASELNPLNIDFLDYFAVIYVSLASVYLLEEFKDHKSVERYYIKALEVRKSILDKHPEELLYKKKVVDAYNSLGYFYASFGDKKDAISNYESSLLLATELHLKSPKDPIYIKDLVLIYNNLSANYSKTQFIKVWKASNSLGTYVKMMNEYNIPLDDWMKNNTRILTLWKIYQF